MLRQMLVAVDFSVCNHCAVQHACDVARAIGGTVTLLHVLEDHGLKPAGPEAAQALLQHLSLLARRPPNCLIVPVRREVNGADSLTGGVALTILAVADQLNAELIVIGLHGQGRSAAGTLGQVLQRVLLEARIPVQVVPCRSTRPIIDRWSVALAEKAAH
ncbi:universal stress protein [Deinococcus oregonensis]|uniref:Universal stress protein n=1 Tax=Deinococcus oregonensis TaxID=1805970 RepID=A0ABV6AW76_9DEIO